MDTHRIFILIVVIFSGQMFKVSAFCDEQTGVCNYGNETQNNTQPINISVAFRKGIIDLMAYEAKVTGSNWESSRLMPYFVNDEELQFIRGGTEPMVQLNEENSVNPFVIFVGDFLSKNAVRQATIIYHSQDTTSISLFCNIVKNTLKMIISHIS